MNRARDRSLTAVGRHASASAHAPFVVGIGASAGGLEALKTLFRRLPERPGIAFVVVVHLSPDHESHLAELLQPHCRMPVHQVTGHEPIEPNRVYVIPPNANLSAIDTHLRLSELEPDRARRAPIDHFLRTLASTHDGRSIGVILTGAGSDGALGLRRIKERGGLTIAQDPQEAEHDGMPRSAIAAGGVDLVLPLRSVGAEILQFCRTTPQLPKPTAEDDARSDERHAEFAAIVAMVLQRTGTDIGVYRLARILRHVRRRMRLRHVESLREYHDFLRRHDDEANGLASDLLANVTEFFSGAAQELLARTVVPSLMEQAERQREPRLRVWTLGCSTGEEAYSLAILLLEEAERRRIDPAIRIFATDFTEDALVHARYGLYPAEIAEQVSPGRLEKYFTFHNGHYRVARKVRDLIVFSAHNLLRDPPYARLNLVICRNLLRDLRPELRGRVVQLFHYGLEPNGVLVLDASETIEERALFQVDEAHASVGRRRPDASERTPIPFIEERLARERSERGWNPDGYRALHEELAQACSPATILIDAQFRVLHYSPDAGRYVRLPGGEPTSTLTKLLREPLRTAVRDGVTEASRREAPVSLGPLTVSVEKNVQRVMLHVRPGKPPRAAGLYLIVLETLEGREAPRPAPPSGTQAEANERIRELEAELALMQRRLERFESEHAESHDRLSWTNELLQSANEELRSVLEELQSSKEELQTANEELTTVDAENRRRVEELAQLSSDLELLMEATGIATLFLNRNLEIVRYTEHVQAFVHVRPTDCGRPLSDLTTTLAYPELLADARAVIDSRTSIEREIRADGDTWYLTRLLPYGTKTGEREGVVITFVDITARRRAEDLLREADRRKDEFLATLAHELRNPLAPIAAGLDLLEGVARDPEAIDTVRSVMARQMQQLVRLVDDLLDISRVSGGRLQLRKTWVDAADVVDDALAAVRPMLSKARHELRVELPETPLGLYVDGARLTQVLTNLLNNAVRYTPEGGRIRLAVERSESDAVMIIEDTGIGMPNDVLDRVFEPFFSQASRDAGSGLGIGLTLAQRLVEMHNGTLCAESEGRGQGSRFIVRLPLTDIPSKAAPAERSERAVHVGDYKVLVVDDNGDVAKMLGMLVKQLGVGSTLTASSGLEALDLGAKVQPDILLLDLGMPDMDGFEVARRVRRAPWGDRLTLVAVTGWGQDKDKRRTKEAGFDDHLVKPVDRAALAAVLARHEARAS